MDKKGFTFVELMIAMVISLIALAGIYNIFILSSRNYFVQESVTDMHQNARASIEFMTRELRDAVIIEAIVTKPGKSSITFYTDTDVGISTGDNGANTLNDGTKSNSWAADEWKNKMVAIIDGRGKGQTGTISSNTSTQLTVTTDWEIIPDNTSVYRIVERKGFSRGGQGGNNLMYTQGGNLQGPAAPQPFAENITSLTLTQDPPGVANINIRRIDIQLTAKTSRRDPNIPDINDQYHYYTVNTSVKLRNRD